MAIFVTIWLACGYGSSIGAMQNMQDMEIVGHVHDEVIIECTPDVSVEQVCELMGQTPEWAEGLLLRADGYECAFYMKQ